VVRDPASERKIFWGVLGEALSIQSGKSGVSSKEKISGALMNKRGRENERRNRYAFFFHGGSRRERKASH